MSDAQDRSRDRRIMAERSVHSLPVRPYIGLTVREAETKAADEGRRLRVLSDLGRGRPSLDLRRVNVVLDDDGRIAEAATDLSPEEDSFRSGRRHRGW